MKKDTRKQYWPIISAVAVIAICYSTFLIKPKTNVAENTAMQLPSPLTRTQATNTPLVIHAMFSQGNKQQLIEATVQKRDTLSNIFARNKMSPREELQILKNPIAKKYLSNLTVEQKILLTVNDHRSLEQLKYVINSNKTLLIQKNGTEFHTEIASKPETVSLLYRSGVIHHSLSETAERAGLPHKMANQLAEIFHNEVNLTHAKGSHGHFSILYKEYYVDGKKVRPGDIVAADLTLHDKEFKAVRFNYSKDHCGYFSPNGYSLEPGYLRTPVHYARISSHFAYRRYDPVLHRVHAHLGVDFAAPAGTPVHTIGDGKVVFEGVRSGYGKSMIIRYSPKYEALYAHLERFAKTIHLGKAVTEGQVIGFVGQTGWATGPHLHYELHVNGKPQDPLQVKLPGKSPIPHKELPQFLETAHSLLAELKGYDEPNFAENENDSGKLNDDDRDS